MILLYYVTCYSLGKVVLASLGACCPLMRRGARAAAPGCTMCCCLSKVGLVCLGASPIHTPLKRACCSARGRSCRMRRCKVSDVTCESLCKVALRIPEAPCRYVHRGVRAAALGVAAATEAKSWPKQAGLRRPCLVGQPQSVCCCRAHHNSR